MRGEIVDTPRGNRPAEELRRTFTGYPPLQSQKLDAALRAERLAVVEQIRERLYEVTGPFTDGEGGTGHRVAGRATVDAILDEVGVAARSAQSDSAGLTEERT